MLRTLFFMAIVCFQTAYLSCYDQNVHNRGQDKTKKSTSKVVSKKTDVKNNLSKSQRHSKRSLAKGCGGCNTSCSSACCVLCPSGGQGPRGAQGAQGPQGPQGQQGLAGADGLDGADGQSGINAHFSAVATLTGILPVVLNANTSPTFDPPLSFQSITDNGSGLLTSTAGAGKYHVTFGGRYIGTPLLNDIGLVLYVNGNPVTNGPSQVQTVGGWVTQSFIVSATGATPTFQIKSPGTLTLVGSSLLSEGSDVAFITIMKIA